MKSLSRRGLLGSLLAAPAIIRTPGLLMPVRQIALPAVAVTAPLQASTTVWVKWQVTIDVGDIKRPAHWTEWQPTDGKLLGIVMEAAA